MHIPDHTLDPVMSVATGVASAAAVGYAFYRLRREPSQPTPSLMGSTAACLFAGQMLNFPIPGGTSGHLLGGVLAAIVLGPWAGMLTVAIVLVVQCLLFQDGGMTALGANILNMALLGAGGGYAVYDLLRRRLAGHPGQVVAALSAAWLSVVAAAALCAVELAWSSEVALSSALAAMLPAHALIGVGEALITGGALACLWYAVPSASGDRPLDTTAARPRFATGLLLALAMAAFLSPLASSFPDGLEAALASLVPQQGAASAWYWSPLADYEVAGLSGFALAGSLAGVIGTVIAYLLGRAASHFHWAQRQPAGA